MGIFGIGKNKIEIDVNKNTHLLVLDNKWHELFRSKKPVKITTIENKLNDLLKLQGSLNDDIKNYQKLKKKLMEDMVQEMENSGQNNIQKTSKYINQINLNLEKAEEKLMEIPKEISEVNKQLVQETMNIFYNDMNKKHTEAIKYGEKVIELREQIKEQIIARDEAKSTFANLYGFLHDVVGADIIDQYDKYYNISREDLTLFKDKLNEDENEDS